MKQKNQLVIYLLAMTLLITGVLYFGHKGHGTCPVCNHSVASEGWAAESQLAKF